MTEKIEINGSSIDVATWAEAWLRYEMKYQANPSEIGEAFAQGNKLFAYLIGPLHPEGGYTAIARVNPNLAAPQASTSPSQPPDNGDIIGDAIKQQFEFFGFNSAPFFEKTPATSVPWPWILLLGGAAYLLLRKKGWRLSG